MERSAAPGLTEEEIARYSTGRHAQQELGGAGEVVAEEEASADEEASVTPDVKLTIGTVDYGSLSVLPPVEPHKRIRVEITHVNAWVPTMFTQPSLLKRLNPFAAKRKLTAPAAPKMRQVRAFWTSFVLCWKCLGKPPGPGATPLIGGVVVPWRCRPPHPAR